MPNDKANLTSEIKKDLENYLEEAAEWLLNYSYRKKQFYKDLGMVGEQTFRSEIIVKTGPGDVVVQEVVRNAQLDYAERWLIAVEIVEESLEAKSKEFLKLRRAAHKKDQFAPGRPGWRKYVKDNFQHQQLTDNKITLWWKRITELMRLVALMRDCYKK